MIMRALRWLRSVIWRRRLEREMREEMMQHVEQSTARLMARGLGESEARRQALREFGNLVYLQEEGRLARGTGGLDALLGDLRYAFRQFRHRKATTFTMLAVLAIGMSISASLFSFLHSYATQPPPAVSSADDLVRIRGSQRAGAQRRVRGITWAEYEQYRTLDGHFESVAAWADASVGLTLPGAGELPRAATAVFVTADYFDVVGVQPVLGRTLAPGGEPAVIIAYPTWETMFGARRDVVGTMLRVNGVPVTIAGVAPPRFNGMTRLSPLKIWLPVELRDRVLGTADPEAEAFRVAARLRPGTSLEAASAAVDLVVQRSVSRPEADAAREAERDARSEVVPLGAANGDPQFKQDLRLMTVAFAGIALIILLVTSTNVSALLAGLAIARRREVAVRLSLGAGRGRIVRQLLTESVILAGVAALIALGILALINRAALTLVPVLPIDIAVRPQAVAFTFATALVIGVLFGLAPALHATRVTVASALRDSSAAIAGRQTRLQRALVIAQIACTQPLSVGVVAMLLLIAGEYRQRGLNDDDDRIVTLRLEPDVLQLPTSTPEQQLLRVRDRLRALPAVEHAIEEFSFSAGVADYGVHSGDRVGDIARPPRSAALTVSPGHLAVHGRALLIGRDFTPADSADAHAAPVIIGDEFARRVWPGANPVGRRLVPPADQRHLRPDLTVVGVFDERPGEGGKELQSHEVLLPPSRVLPAAASGLLLRTRGPAASHLQTIRAAIFDEVPNAAVTTLRTEAEENAEIRKAYALGTAVLAGAGLLALGLAAIGLYAVVALAVGQRTNEIAVRMAVGASAWSVVRRFVREGLLLSAAGIVVGLPLSLLLLRALQADFLPDVPMPGVGAIAGLGVLAVAAAAAWVPARHAATVDPASVLRRE